MTKINKFGKQCFKSKTILNNSIQIQPRKKIHAVNKNIYHRRSIKKTCELQPGVLTFIDDCEKCPRSAYIASEPIQEKVGNKIIQWYGKMC